MKLVSDGILAILLPTEDLESGCERTLLREILSSLVFGNVLDKLSEPFMIYELIATAVRQLRPDRHPSLVLLLDEVLSSPEYDYHRRLTLRVHYRCLATPLNAPSVYSLKPSALYTPSLRRFTTSY
jgi:hypothetical protein